MTTLNVDFDSPTVEVSDGRLRKLRIFNALMGTLHLASGAAMLVLGDTGFDLSTTTFNVNGPPGTPLAEGAINEVGGVPLALGTSAFLLLSALFHFIIATVGFGFYGRELRRGRNRFRWVEYSLVRLHRRHRAVGRDRREPRGQRPHRSGDLWAASQPSR